MTARAKAAGYLLALLTAIQLRRDASRSDLSDAVRALMTARLIGGDVPTKGATLRLRPQQRTAKPRKDFPWADRVMSDVRKAERKTIKGVGNGRMVVIHLPSQAR